MTENEKIMDDLQKPWEQKLAEAKAKSNIDHAAIEEEQKDFDAVVESRQSIGNDEDDNNDSETKASRRASLRHKRRHTFGTINEDRSYPYILNLHEDPQLSGVVFYTLSSGEIHIGRRSGDPVPQIILGAIGIKPNHAKITLQPNGLFELSVCDIDAANNTMVNGKNLPKKRTRLLNHLDRIAFSGGAIYVFFYPLLN